MALFQKSLSVSIAIVTNVENCQTKQSAAMLQNVPDSNMNVAHGKKRWCLRCELTDAPAITMCKTIPNNVSPGANQHRVSRDDKRTYSRKFKNGAN